MSRAARPATMSRSPTTPAVTAIARSARARPRERGSNSGRPTCCPCPPTTSCSPCRRRSPRLHSRTRPWSTACCFAPLPTRSSRSQPTRGTSAPGSASPPCSTPGARRSPTTRMCTSWCPAAGSPRTGRAGSPAGPGFFLPVRVLSRLFRRLFLDRLEAVHHASKLAFFADLAHLADPAAFVAHLAPLRRSGWVVYAKRPFAGPGAVLAYLSRYTHRVAIANSRLLALDERGVTFRWKDYRARDG